MADIFPLEINEVWTSYCNELTLCRLSLTCKEFQEEVWIRYLSSEIDFARLALYVETCKKRPKVDPIEKICEKLMRSPERELLRISYLPAQYTLNARATQRLLLTMIKLHNRISSLVWTCIDSEMFGGQDALLRPQIAVGRLSGAEIFMMFDKPMPKLKHLHLHVESAIPPDDFQRAINNMDTVRHPSLRSLTLSFHSLHNLTPCFDTICVKNLCMRFKGRLQRLTIDLEDTKSTGHGYWLQTCSLGYPVLETAKKDISSWNELSSRFEKEVGLPLSAIRWGTLSVFGLIINIYLPSKLGDIKTIFASTYPPTGMETQTKKRWKERVEASHSVAAELMQLVTLSFKNRPKESHADLCQWIASVLDQHLENAHILNVDHLCQPKTSWKENSILATLLYLSARDWPRSLEASRIQKCLEIDPNNWITIFKMLQQNPLVPGVEFRAELARSLPVEWRVKFQPPALAPAINTLLST